MPNPLKISTICFLCCKGNKTSKLGSICVVRRFLAHPKDFCWVNLFLQPKTNATQNPGIPTDKFSMNTILRELEKIGLLIVRAATAHASQSSVPLSAALIGVNFAHFSIVPDCADWCMNSPSI